MAGIEIPTPREFFLHKPFYLTFDFSGNEVWRVLDIYYFAGTYDNFCTKCGRLATFKGTPPNRTPAHTRNERLEALQGDAAPIPVLTGTVFTVRAVCTRTNSHFQDFIFSVDRESRKVDDNSRYVGTIQKIGQLPSSGDMHIAEIKKYSAVLSKPKMAEFNRAIGLASHDVGVGSYVYLRRIFEDLVEAARTEATSDSDWDDALFVKSRMSEKIALLKNHLPPFLVSHPAIYSLLSKGIHELSEQECLANFGPLRIGIELILDEKLERLEKAKKQEAASAAISKAAQGRK